MSRHPKRRATRHSVVAAAAAVGLVVTASAASASDTLPWEGDRAPGANQPYQHAYNPDQLLRWNPATDPDAQLLRSQVPLQQRAEPVAATQRNPQLPAQTQHLMLAGDYGNAFFESHPYTNVFAQHLFNYWQYTDFYASWHGMAAQGTPPSLYDPEKEWTQRWFEFGAINLPNPGYTDAAHRNGVKSLGTIFFSDNDRGSQDYRELLVRDEQGNFPAVDKLTEIADYFGFDGYFVNQEQDSVSMTDQQIRTYRQFLAALRAEGLYVQWYDSVTESGDIDYQNEFNSANSGWVKNEDLGRLTDSIFLNYWWNHDKLAESAEHARSLGLDPRTSVFAGIEAGMYQFDQPYDLRDNLDSEGAPMNAIATLGADFVHADAEHKTENDHQWQTFDRARRWWTGTPTGAGTPEEDQWQGIDSYITARTPITGTTFATSFNTGHGLGYWRDGEQVSQDEWGNIGIQDIPVSWQWWLTGPGADGVQVDYDYGPDYTSADRFSYQHVEPYQGGSSLVISGELAQPAHLRLYKTDLEVTGTTDVAVTYRTEDAPVDLSLEVTLASDPDEVVSVPVETTDSDGQWSTADVDLSEFAGDRVLTLGLGLAPGEAAADSTEDFQINLGELVFTDSAKKPQVPQDFHIDQALTGTDELSLSWDLAPFSEVTRYEVYAGDQYLGSTYNNRLYVKDFTQRAGTLQLVAIGPDGSESKPATADFRFAGGPGDLSTSVQENGDVQVSWERPVHSTATVTLVGKDSGNDPFTTSTTVRPEHGPPHQRTTSVTFSDVPKDGSEFVARLEAGNATPVSAIDQFADQQIEPYPADFAEFEDGAVTIRRPVAGDWHTLTILEDGEPLTFETTYSQGTRDQMIRGRVMRSSLHQPLKGSDTEVVAILQDYSGNTARTVLREGR